MCACVHVCVGVYCTGVCMVQVCVCVYVNVIEKGINILPRTCQLLVCEESTPTACTVIVYDGCAGNSSAKLDS